MRDYFYGKFPEQLRQLELRPVSTAGSQRVDPTNAFFGGQHWQRVRRDMIWIPPDDKSYFIFSLFMIVLTDQAIYRHFPTSYAKWRAKTGFPKFGRSDFPPRNENPMHILWAPEREKVLPADEMTALLPDFVSFWTEETADLFHREYPEIPVKDYFTRVRNDSAWRSANEGTVVLELKRLLEVMPQPFGGK